MTAFNPTLSAGTLADVIKSKDWCDTADAGQILDLIILAESDDDAEETEKMILDLSTDAEPEEVEQFLLGEYGAYSESEDKEDVPFGY